MKFEDLGLSEKTIKAIKEVGIGEPTTVQCDVIPSILEGKDVFTIAPGGCGKTCSYVFPLIDIMAQKKAKNILIITSGAKQSVTVSDRFAVFNKYHEFSETAVTDDEENVDTEANVIIASPDLLSDLINEGKVDVSATDILVVDDINLIKKFHQLAKLEKILEKLPAEKQNIIFTNRRSKETQDILDKILQTPAEIKVDKNKELEAVNSENVATADNTLSEQKAKKSESKKHSERNIDKELSADNKYDSEAMRLVKQYHVFGRKTPEYLLINTDLAEDE